MVCRRASYWYCIRCEFDTLKGIIRNHLPQQYRFSGKDIGTDSSYDDSKLFTTILGACRVILGSTHPDKYDVLHYLVDF